MMSERQKSRCHRSGHRRLGDGVFLQASVPERDVLVLERNGEGAAGCSAALDGSHGSLGWPPHAGLRISRSLTCATLGSWTARVRCMKAPIKPPASSIVAPVQSSRSGIASQNLPQREGRVFTVDYISRRTSGTVAVAARLFVDADRSRNNAGITS